MMKGPISRVVLRCPPCRRCDSGRQHRDRVEPQLPGLTVASGEKLRNLIRRSRALRLGPCRVDAFTPIGRKNLGGLRCATAARYARSRAALPVEGAEPGTSSRW